MVIMQQLQQVQFMWLLLLSTILWYKAAQAHEYLKEPPEFLKPCSLKDAQSNDCLAASIENIFRHWRGGVPGLRDVGALDPFRVGKLRIAQRVPPNVDVKVELRNMTTYGLGQSKILNSTTLLKSGYHSLGFHVQISKINITSHYKLRGHVLLLNLNSSGIFKAALDNLEFYVLFKMKPQQMDGLTFMNISAVKTDIVRIDKIHVHFANLFNGNRELENSANDLFNGNWRVLFELLRPVLTQTFDRVIKDRFKKIFEYLPAKYIFEEFQ